MTTADDPLPFHLQAAEGFVRAREALRASDRAHTDALLADWLDAFETDIAAFIRPLLQPVVDHPDTPAPLRDLLANAVNPEHFSQVWILFALLMALARPLADAAETGIVQGIQQAALTGAQNTPLSPAELALGLIRHTIGIDFANTEAAKSGISKELLAILTLNTGEPPGPQELTALFNRELITRDQWNTGIHQSRLRDEWLDPLFAGRLALPGPAEIVNGVIKQRLDPGAGAVLFGQVGMAPENWDWIIKAAGRPYGIEQALELWNRETATPGTGISETEVRTVIAHSDVNPEFTDDILKLRWYIPPVRSIMPMLRSGAIDDAKATELFTEQGVRPSDIPGYLAEAHHGRTATVRQLTEAQVVRMYSAQLIDRPTALGRLTALRITPEDAALLLDYADNVRHEQYVTAIVNRVHARYVSWKLTDAEAMSALGADGISAVAQQDYLKLWRIERDANVHVLTPAAIVGAYRRKQIGPAECKARLFAVGVQQADLAIVVADAYPPTKPAPTEVAAVVNA